LNSFLSVLLEMIRPMNLLDILLIAVIFYGVFMLVKGTRAVQLLKGLAIILGLSIISDLVGLTTVNWLLVNLQTVFIVAIPIIFQPELRRALEKLGTTGSLWNIFRKDDEEHPYDDVVDKIITTMVKASKEHVGVLIVIQRDMGLGEYTDTGIQIDGLVTSALLSNIFVVNTPLHDGAVIIDGDRVVAASCYLPLSDSNKISKDLGTRHRAAIGITEVTDALSLIVSEETGAMSLADGGVLIRDVNEQKLRELVLRKLSKDSLQVGEIFDKWGKRKDEKNKHQK